MTAAQDPRLRDLRSELDRLLGSGSVLSDVSAVLSLTEAAEDEIRAAQRGSRAYADQLYHSFRLLTPTGVMEQRAEFVYRAHARELLARVIAGSDTRPGTAAEVALACAEASAVAPLTDVGAGLYGRMWALAGFPGGPFALLQDHHEALGGILIDTAEREARRKLAVPGRKLADVACNGWHWGEQVRCLYQQPVQLELGAA